MFCPYCGKEIDDGSEVCSICNSNLKLLQEPSEFSCDKCNASISADAKFCFKCGEKFEDDTHKNIKSKYSHLSDKRVKKLRDASGGIIFFNLLICLLLYVGISMGELLFASILLIIEIGILFRFAWGRIGGYIFNILMILSPVRVVLVLFLNHSGFEVFTLYRIIIPLLLGVVGLSIFSSDSKLLFGPNRITHKEIKKLYKKRRINIESK